MSLLSELTTLLSPIVQVETGVFSEPAPEQYLVLTPLSDTFQLFADNAPNGEVQEVRLSLFTKGSYTAIKNKLVRVLLDADITITDRRYIGHEDDTGYFHFVLDCGKWYEIAPNYERKV